MSSFPTGNLTETAYAKLNLALHVRGKREDGYHEIETIFAFCEDGDELSAEAADELSLESSGPFAADVPGDDANLVMEAARVLRLATGIEAGARLHLVKNLPAASGIGGGSADAAAVLRLLTRLWGIEPAVAVDVAPLLGADVPACLLSQRSVQGQPPALRDGVQHCRLGTRSIEPVPARKAWSHPASRGQLAQQQPRSAVAQPSREEDGENHEP